MANVRSGNNHYVDTAGVLTSEKNVRVSNIIITATAANAVVAFQDASGTYDVLNLRVVTSGATQQFTFLDTPLLFPIGVKVSTLTNAIVMVIYTKASGQ